MVQIVVIFSIFGRHFLDQSHSNPDVMWPNDYAISRDNCAISQNDYAISHSPFKAQDWYWENYISGKSDIIIS